MIDHMMSLYPGKFFNKLLDENIGENPEKKPIVKSIKENLA